MILGTIPFLFLRGFGESTTLFPIFILLVLCSLILLTYLRHRLSRETARLAETCQLKDIIHFLPDPTFVIDRDHRVVAWNRAMEELSGVSAREMLGMEIIKGFAMRTATL